MAARRRVDIFFILYLTAIVAFVVVSKERDRTDKEMQVLNEQIVQTLIPAVPLRTEGDTLRCYVDADSSGIVVGAPIPFRMRLFVEDIAPEDDVTVTVHSVLFEDTLTAPDLVALGSRMAVGDVSDNIVAFPLAATFPRTGIYEINLGTAARRVHEVDDGVFEYRGRRFDTTLISRQTIRKVERAVATMIILVEDTSRLQPRNLQDLRITTERTDIASAVGFEEHNSLFVNLPSADPDVRIVRGSGALRLVGRTDREAEYLWTGTTTSIPDTVIVEARTRRDAGGKDVAQARFALHGEIPFLSAPRLETVYAGEEIRFDVRVTGLGEESAYQWKLYEEAGNSGRLIKSEGRGTLVTYRIPNSYAGKTLLVDARYRGRTYRVYSLRSHAVGDSFFPLRVVDPPTRIAFELPARAPVTSTFGFTASRYADEQFRGEQPVDRLADVDVEVRDESGAQFATDVWMVRKGVFEFTIADRHRTRLRGQRVLITLRAGDGLQRRSIVLY
ncbi:MAG: hypothetical protein KFF77_10305 [Bacteroidetes bacterium]|nr:hypothetical protein [Bacteroidota bacterium]